MKTSTRVRAFNFAIGLVLAPWLLGAAPTSPVLTRNVPVGEVTEIGSRRELFVDDALVASVSGDLALRLHRPTPREVVIVHDAPWEGAGSGYHSVFRDGDLYRMYYKAWQRTVGPGTVDRILKRGGDPANGYADKVMSGWRKT